jgi:hypothetical protein
LTNAVNDLSNAQLAVAHGWTAAGYSINIYTPNPHNASQEYITVSTPEPSEIALLGVYLSSFAGLVLLARKRGWLFARG